MPQLGSTPTYSKTVIVSEKRWTKNFVREYDIRELL